VKVGDQVRKGQILADSNFTRNGTLALGTNLKTAYIPYGGLNFEDGIVISDSAAEKLTSVHIHRETVDIDDGTIVCPGQPGDASCGATDYCGGDAQYGWDLANGVSERFEVDGGDEPVVTDTITGHQWQGCAAGQSGGDPGSKPGEVAPASRQK